jgi:nitrite reductase/ring-hydroxylating ferredoxin subunit
MSSNDSTSRGTSDACTGCAPFHARREFLKTLAASAAGALLTLGASPAAARALDMGFVGASERRGSEASYPVPDADGATIDPDNEVILVRYHNAVYAFALSCPHQNTGLKWLGDEGRFQCPKHKSKYQPDGVFIEGRATRGMDRYAVRRDGAKVVVDLDKLIEQDKDGAGWSAAQIPLS